MVPKLTLALRLARRFPDNPSLLAELREDKTDPQDDRRLRVSGRRRA